MNSKEILRARNFRDKKATKIKRQENDWNKTTAFVVFFTTSVAKMFTTNFCELFHDNILRESDKQQEEFIPYLFFKSSDSFLLKAGSLISLTCCS